MSFNATMTLVVGARQKHLEPHMTQAQMTLAECIDRIEARYELMLAYAAQGRDFESAGGDGPPIRQCLIELREALIQVGDRFEQRCELAQPESRAAFIEFCNVLRHDAERARTAVDVVLAVDNIGSQLVDNLNASMHLRALLTDMFLLDEASSGLK